MKLSWNGLVNVPMPLLAPPEAGAGGGAGAGGDAGDAGGGDDGGAGDDDHGEAGDGTARHAAAGDDDTDPEDDGLAPEIANDPKRLRTRLRRTQRQLKPFRDVEGALRDPASGRLLTPQEITRRFSLADDQAELNAFFAEHPDMLEQILERKRGGGRREAAAPEFVDPFADPSKLPFDATDEAGRFFVDNMRAQAKENFELRQLLNEIKQGLGGVQQGVQRDRLTRVEETWKTNTLGAARTAGLDAEDTKDFVNNVYRDFRLLGAEKKLDKADVREVIARNLRPFSRHAAGRKRGDAATQQRMADGNARRPGPHGQGAPTTAQAKTSNGKETIRDGRKSFFERAGQTPPAH